MGKSCYAGGLLALAAAAFIAGVLTERNVGGLASLVDASRSWFPTQTDAQAGDSDPTVFYRDPMGAPAVSRVPMKDSMDMDYLPVRRSEAVRLLSKLPRQYAPAGEELPVFYRDPMGGTDISMVPRKDSMEMEYLPVFPSEIAAVLPPIKVQQAAVQEPAGSRKGKIKYYRNPMGLPDTSPVPKKDSMGMDYIPVYEDEDEGGGTIAVSPARVQTLGVRTEAVARRPLVRTVRAVGVIAADERLTTVVAPRVEGWIETLHANETGRVVARGEPLMSVFSPELLRAQSDFLLAARGTRPGDLEAGRYRLLNLGLSNQQVEEVRESGRVLRAIEVPAPASGTVVAKTALAGMMFKPGDALFTIADLTRIVTMAEVYEIDLGFVRTGTPAVVRVNAYPGAEFRGTVDRIYPVLSESTRTAKVRVTIDNADGRLRPQMLATLDLETSPGDGSDAVLAPVSAVIDSGTRKVVLVATGEGRFRPTEIRTGRRSDGWIEVLEGLAGDERVVTGANFLIDAESNLRAALAAFAEPSGKETQP
jgi:membrane fusion protein, copper/silver efflux system